MRKTALLIIDSLPRSTKKFTAVLFDLFLGFSSTWLAFCLRYDEFVAITTNVATAAGVSALLIMPVFSVCGLYRTIFRYTGWFAAKIIIRAAFLYASIYSIIFLIIGIDGVPRSIGLIQPILVFVGVGLSRAFAKLLINSWSSHLVTGYVPSVALIYGAGSAGRQLSTGLREGVSVKPIGFVDDAPSLRNTIINGLPVYSLMDVTPQLLSDLGVTDILLAMPSVSRLRQHELLNTLTRLPVKVRLLPGLTEVANGEVKVEDIRHVEIEDVLGREPVQPYNDQLLKKITGKSVMVTGAGGSIGSEICRQIVEQKPTTLVLLEVSEYALYKIERELMELNDAVNIESILGSVLDENNLSRVMKRYNVDTVYHAAAYKHVPMVESNVAAGVWNNVFGTLKAVDAASKSGVRNFVLISTDKAVRPTSVMGCSKRLAELVLQAKHLDRTKSCDKTTKLTMVRFGNVLGSSGSVIPLFKDQIRQGGPVTVTHPEIIRYFMTIPEAAQLVVQAGAIGQGGDVMVLDMGQPIKIVELAKRMIHLSGFTHKDRENPDGEIEIKFTGLRPGEKLFEELLIGENTLKTAHPRIMRAIEPCISLDDLEIILRDLEFAVKSDDKNEILKILKKAVPEFIHNA